MATLTTSGRAAMAASLLARTMHLAWGSGDPSWDATPLPESLDAVGLTNELGRVALSAAEYVIPDEIGDIEVPTGRFSLSPDPTNHLYLRFDFGFTDAPDQTIREAGLFIDTVIEEGLDPGQQYFPPDNIVDAGKLVALEHFTGVVRSTSVRQQFEFVLTI